MQREITVDDIIHLYRSKQLSFTTARNELVYEHCLSVGNATELLLD